MTIFHVDTETLSSKSTEVQGTIGRLQAEVNSMHAGLAELEGLWKGQAASNFQQLMVDWRAAQARVEESLAGINEALARASQHYAEAESANARMFMH